MIRRLAVVAALAALMVVVGSARADDQEKFQGTWKAEKAVRGGTEAPADELAKMVIQFKGNKAIPEEKPDDAAEFTLDESKKPKAIDVKTPKGETMQGIYVLEGDTLKLCFAREGDRPTKFESAEGSKLMMVILKKQKK